MIQARSRATTVLVAVLVAATAIGCGSDGPSTASRRTDGDAARRSLASKLPGAAVIGHGYSVKANSFTDPVEPYDPATTTTTTVHRFNVLDKHCPDAAWPHLDAHPTVEGVEYVTFAGPDERDITVGYAPLPASLDRAGMERLLRAIGDCGTITDDDAGFAVDTTTIRAEQLNGVGDYGIDIHWSTRIDAKGQTGHNPMGDSTSRTYLFVVDDTLVAVVASGGFDLDHFTNLPPDEDLVPTIAAAAADRLAN